MTLYQYNKISQNLAINLDKKHGLKDNYNRWKLKKAIQLEDVILGWEKLIFLTFRVGEIPLHLNDYDLYQNIDLQCSYFFPVNISQKWSE